MGTRVSRGDVVQSVVLLSVVVVGALGFERLLLCVCGVDGKEGEERCISSVGGCILRGAGVVLAELGLCSTPSCLWIGATIGCVLGLERAERKNIILTVLLEFILFHFISCYYNIFHGCS
ncbi:hypothetical protein GALMADRAFT_803485 [Galerina marginata CBS 339.88]|uniref:Uncharacterized protein n=1 Tax=Galerina marginata (strain CBS 339.88) TaxID=685588 RepID=A0A067STQ0_GALM3|nr:hypothetical protein GALMADRAFT_803485 [Galerina marginata CBS 339.88]